MSRWTDPDWRASAHEWINEELERNGYDLAGEIEQPHVYPWSTVMTISTTTETLYFKANSPELAHEAALVSLLATVRPDCIPEPISVDRERGWMLMHDAGTRLRELIEQERDLARWLEVLPLYADVQIDLNDRVDELLAIEVPDMRLATLTSKFERFLDEFDDLPPDDLRRLTNALPTIEKMSAELASYRIPETIQHDDFHDGQVFVRNDRYLLLDWGDACVSHPFFTLSVTLEGSIAWGLDDVQGSVAIEPFRDAYLARFAQFGSLADLAAAATIAMRLGWVCRVVNGHIPGDPDPTIVRLQMLLDGFSI